MISLFAREGSTRGVGLLRIGLALLCWTRWSSELLPFRDTGAEHWLLGASFFLSTSLLLAGLWTRAAAAWAAATLLYMFVGMGILQGREAWTHHHTTLITIAVCLLVLVPCGGSFSADRWLAVRRARRLGAPPPDERGPLWAVPLFAVQVSAIYFWGAFDKTSWAFASGTRMTHHFMSLYLGSDPVSPWVAAAMMPVALSVLAIEYGLAVSLWIPLLRAPSIAVGIVFHFLLYYLLPVGPFSLTMVLLYLAYLDQDRLHAWIDDLMGWTPAPPRPG